MNTSTYSGYDAYGRVCRKLKTYRGAASVIVDSQIVSGCHRQFAIIECDTGIVNACCNIDLS